MTLTRSKSGTPLWVGWTKEFRTHRKRKDDPVRHERLAAIGNMGYEFAFIKSDDVYFGVPMRPENDVHCT